MNKEEVKESIVDIWIKYRASQLLLLEKIINKMKDISGSAEIPAHLSKNSIRDWRILDGLSSLIIGNLESADASLNFKGEIFKMLDEGNDLQK